MTNTYTLDSLKADLDREFAPLVLEIDDKTVTLQNVLRLDKKDRDKVLALIDEMKDEDDDTSSVDSLEHALTTIKEIVTIVSKGKLLSNAIGDDIALAQKILKLWMEATQPGEAESSPS